MYISIQTTRIFLPCRQWSFELPLLHQYPFRAEPFGAYALFIMATTPNHEKAQVGAEVKKNTKLFLRCFDSVRQHKQYWNKWILDDGWIDIIEDRFEIPTSLKFDSSQLNGAISRDPRFCGIDTVGDANLNGVYKATYNERVGKKKSRLTAYYVTTPNTLPQKPGGNTKWFRDIVSTVQKLPNTRHNPTKRSVPVEPVPTNKTLPAPTRKRRRVNEQEQTNDTPEQAEVDPNPIAQVEANPNPIAQAILNQSWWDAGDAIRYFGSMDGDVSPKEAVEERILKLKRGYATSTGWKLAIDDFDQQDLCSPHERFNFQMKCRYVSLALRYALADMPGQTWLECCQDVVASVNRVDGVDHIKNKETVSRWHLAFRRNNESFPNPHVHSKDGNKTSLPPLLDRHPELARSIIQYAKQNLNELSAELIYSYLHEIALPVLLDERRAELVDESYTMQQLLQENQLTKVSMTTIFRWMRRLGFKYEVRRKCYYVDGHEKPETKKYRKTMVSKYLENELRMYRWIQLPLTELNDLEEQLEIEIGNGHHYTDPTSNVPMVELHVDSHPTFHAQMNATTQFGGNLSVRMPQGTLPLICFGQDECIFKQFLFTGKAWSAPDGTKPVIPKDEGLGVMISAFVSREFGFGMVLSAEDLQKVNEYRQGKDYSDGLAAMDKRGTAAKQPLGSSPFVVQFEYGIIRRRH
jgi:hypothetical protein